MLIFEKKNVSFHEYMMHSYVQEQNFDFVPHWLSYDFETKIMLIEKIDQMNVADMYGADFSSVPESIIKQMREIIKTLYSKNIVYPDITPYNFIEDKEGKVWIIDFEHCFFLGAPEGDTTFVEAFINGEESWNEAFL